MKSAPRAWLVFSACAILLAAMLVWLALWTLQLERERETARQQLVEGRNALALEERINSAFWRLDSLMTLLISQESARDPAEYEPFLPAGAGDRGYAPEGLPEPSPLLETPSEFVRLHFQVTPEGGLTSPQAPRNSFCEMAVACGASQIRVDQAARLLDQLRPLAGYATVSLLCPKAEAPADKKTAPWIVEQNRPAPLGNDTQGNFVAPLWAVGDESVLKPDNAGRTWFLDRAASVDRSMASYMADNGSREVDSRARQSFNAMRNIQQSNQQQQGLSAAEPVAVGLMRPVWMGGELMLLREVIADGQPLVQGCWLDWERLSGYLRSEVSDLFREVEFSPVRPGQPIDPSRTLTTLPVALGFPDGSALGLPLPLDDQPTEGGVWPALVAASLTSFLAVVALGVLLAGVLRLSERRATFVSAVSHELRTPLTTFRLYSEMLADGMVTDPAKQAEYLQTLKTESERLGHLVDNVLVYAGLEHRATSRVREQIRIGDLVQRVAPVLERITGQADRPLVGRIEPAALNAVLESDSAAIERILVNLVDNAVKYGRNPDQPEINWEVTLTPRQVSLSIRDFGPGIPSSRRRRIFAPYTRSDVDGAGDVPGVGLGLALCKRMAQSLGGSIRVEDAGPGTKITLWLDLAARIADRPTS